MSRFVGDKDPRFEAINRSLDFDKRLWPFDIAQSKAHVTMLARAGVIEDSDRDAILAALSAVEAELASGEFKFLDSDEDIHMAVERRATEIAGAVGGKMHTARSRNDQVATDLVLFVRSACDAAIEQLDELLSELLAKAKTHADWPMPAYTHLQRAQPVYLGHHLLAYFWMFVRDRERFRFARQATDAMPLGSGALAGVNFDTDREWLAAELGFKRPTDNSLDAVSNRDFAIDYLSAAATCSTHLSRLGSELVIFASQEFSFVEMSDAFASGSSLMPQKKNPDAAELLRAKAPRVVGHLSAFHGLLHALPLTYSKDLQEDKEHIFDTADTMTASLAAAAGLVESTTWNRERLAEAAADELLAATDLADLLVRQGVPFRDAHGQVAGIVRCSLETGKPLSELSSEELGEGGEQLIEPLRELLSDLGWIESKQSQGGTASVRLAEQLNAAQAALND